jgi:alpha-tubulin suppressor-like RCC1 family protein
MIPLVSSSIPIAKAEQSLVGWKDIAVGGELSLGIKNDGTVWAWGENNSY